MRRAENAGSSTQNITVLPMSFCLLNVVCASNDTNSHSPFSPVHAYSQYNTCQFSHQEEWQMILPAFSALLIIIQLSRLYAQKVSYDANNEVSMVTTRSTCFFLLVDTLQSYLHNSLGSCREQNCIVIGALDGSPPMPKLWAVRQALSSAPTDLCT